MRVLDIITEQTAAPSGDPLDLLSATAVINRTNGTQEQVQRIQELLSQHRRNGQAFYSGPTDGIWSAALDNAIRNWKTYINDLLGDNTLNTATTAINTRAVRYLRAPLTADGGIDLPEFRGRQEIRGNPFQGQRFQNSIHEPNPEWTGNRTQDMRIFVSSIGISGWLAILNEQLEHLRDRSDVRRRQIVTLKLNDIGRDFDSPSRWQNGFARAMEIERYPGRTVDVNGQQMALIAPNMGSGNDAPRRLFEYYAALANAILSRDAQRDQEARQDVQDRVDQTGSGLDQATLAVLAQRMNEAFSFSLTTGGTNEEGIEDVLLRLRRPGDFDALETKYNSMFAGEDMSNIIAEELNDEDYNRYVRPSLLRIGRINPTGLLRSIRFGNEDTVTVTYDDTTWVIHKDLINGSVNIDIQTSGSAWIDGNTEAAQRDLILQDAVLRQAVNDSGGTVVTEVEVRVGDASWNRARAVFELELQENIPELITFYTHNEPFNAMAANIGGIRARGIITQLAQLKAINVPDDELRGIANEEIMSDREKLIEARVYFDERYAQEVSSSLPGFANLDDVDGADDDEVEVLEVHEDLANRFAGEGSEDSDTVEEAVREILNSDNPADMWEKVSIAARQAGYVDRSADMSIDTIHDPNAESILSLLEGEQNDNIMFRLLTGNIPIYLFPTQVSMAYREAVEGAGTTESILTTLLSLIDDKSQFEVIVRQYRRLYNEDLIIRIRSEDETGNIYRSYYEKFDLQNPIRISMVETPFGDFQWELPNASNRFKFVLQPDSEYFSSIPPRFGEIVDENQPREGWLGRQYNRWVIFSAPSGGDGTPRIPSEIMEEFQLFLNRIGYNEEGEPITSE